jgi:hypothetical protein
MPVEIVPMPLVIGKEDQELPPSISFHAVFVLCVITGGSAMPSQKASVPLVALFFGHYLNGFEIIYHIQYKPDSFTPRSPAMKHQHHIHGNSDLFIEQ